jgi:hypothetical protein
MEAGMLLALMPSPWGSFCPSMLALLLILLGASPVASAQDSGSLEGTILDPDGLEVPSATVTLIETRQVGSRKVRSTDGIGHYRFDSIPPGLYDLTASKPGFQTITVVGVQVLASSVVTQNVALPFSEAAEFVDVWKATEPLCAVTGQVLTKDFLRTIPTGPSRWHTARSRMHTYPSGGMNGFVQDVYGFAIFSVRVKLTSMKLANPRIQTTNRSGCVRFSALRPGVYNLTVSKYGFQTVRIKGLVVRDSHTTTEAVVLAPVERSPEERLRERREDLGIRRDVPKER